MSSQLALEILTLSAGLSQFSNFQLLNLGQQNSLVALAPELVQFIGGCGACDNQLASLFASNLNLNGLNLNLGQCNDCLQQLVDLQGLFVSGLDLGNNTNNANETENANQDENLNEEEQAKADEEAKLAEEEAAKQAEEDAAAAGNKTANAKEGENANQDENLNEEEQAKADEEAKLAEEEAAKQAEGEDAAANEEDAAASGEGEGEGEKKASAGRKASEKMKMKMKKSTIVQRSAAGKRVPGMGKMKVVGSVGFAAVMGALVWGL
ncbi:hypothetical protein ONS95_004214 [Cadophora gregata]|uniref:uncharacterized protein n=1 Tax=Cadophora gregata TaxID=51156 RepID=UPI0026DCF0CD|nr:uncharacterized protein ONS95_004214 [Cadophora gregata]KAK0105414.1 hypothetical protein ONS96_004804 [Cadophora gregata f. sp. sojae]KAK0105687.1 hypothetical protein ONS95_004214 [Cadophora gregata]